MPGLRSADAASRLGLRLQHLPGRKIHDATGHRALIYLSKDCSVVSEERSVCSVERTRNGSQVTQVEGDVWLQALRNTGNKVLKKARQVPTSACRWGGILQVHKIVALTPSNI